MRVAHVLLIIFSVVGLHGCHGAVPAATAKTSPTMSNEQAQSALQAGDTAFQKLDFDAARQHYEQARDLADEHGETRVLAEAISQLARLKVKAGDLNAAAILLKQARETASQDAPLGWSRYLGVKGRLEWHQKEETAATATFTEYYDYSRQHDLHDRAVDAANLLTIVGDLDSKIAWGYKGVKQAKEGNVEGWLAPLYNNLGWNLHDAGRNEEALEALQEAREAHWKGTRELPKLIADYGVGFIHRELGNLEEAGTWLRPTLAWAERLEAQDRLAGEESSPASQWFGFAANELAKVAEAQGRTDDARQLLEMAVPRLREAGMPEWDADGFAKIAERLAGLAK